MNKNDEAELHRLTNSLSEINKKAKLTDKEGEALKKAGLALSVSFIHGLRKEIEDIYKDISKSLSTDQKQYLKSLGIDQNDRAK